MRYSSCGRPAREEAQEPVRNAVGARLLSRVPLVKRVTGLGARARVRAAERGAPDEVPGALQLKFKFKFKYTNCTHCAICATYCKLKLRARPRPGDGRPHGRAQPEATAHRHPLVRGHLVITTCFRSATSGVWHRCTIRLLPLPLPLRLPASLVFWVRVLARKEKEKEKEKRKENLNSVKRPARPSRPCFCFDL